MVVGGRWEPVSGGRELQGDVCVGGRALEHTYACPRPISVRLGLGNITPNFTKICAQHIHPRAQYLNA